MKKHLILLLLCVCTLNMLAYPKVIPSPNDVIPADAPTLEALISLHKTVASWEDKAKNNIAASTVEQEAVTTQTNKFYEVRDMLNSKLDAGYQWLTLAGSISTLTISTANLAKEYVNFTKFFVQNVKKKPQIAFHYAECNYMVYKKVMLIEKQMATLAAYNFNVFKASMKERMQLIWDMQNDVNAIRDLIDNSYWWCKCVVIGGFHYDFIWEILNSKVLEEIANDVVNQWNTDQKNWV